MYATALTALCLDRGYLVVDPSPPVAERIHASFETGVPDVRFEDSRDRAGVEISGTPAAVDSITDLLASCSIDTLRFDAVLPRAGVYVGQVEDTAGSGATVETGTGVGFLPFGRADGHVDEGDQLTVSVTDPSPPWRSGRRPVLTGGLRLTGVFVTLVRGEEGTIIDAPSDAIAQTVDRLGPTLPPQWGIEIHRQAQSVDPATLRAELGRLGDQIERIEGSLRDHDDADVPGLLEEPMATTWCRFGREGRFALDAHRGGVTHTIDGHHRIKASGPDGGSAVDLLEAYAVDGIDFDPDVIMETFGPMVGDRIRIEHGKPGRGAIDLGRADVTERDEDGSVTVSRTLSSGGSLDALDAPKEDGDTAETTFVEGRWWYPTVYRSAEGTYKGTYVNVGTPLEVFPDRVSYVDLFVDVVKHPDGTVDIVDRSELRAAVDAGNLGEDLAEKAESVAAAISRAF